MKSRKRDEIKFFDEIVLFAHDEIKSVFLLFLNPPLCGFHLIEISSNFVGFHPSFKTDLITKGTYIISAFCVKERTNVPKSR